MAFYKAVGIKNYDPKAQQANKFIGRKCEPMGGIEGVTKNPDGSYNGQFGFRDEYKIYTFEGLILEPWPKTPKDEEDIL